MAVAGSGPWWSVWAKSSPYPPAEVEQWLPLHQHLDDAGGVAGLLFDHWVPVPVVRRIAEETGSSVRVIRDLYVWLAAVHDVGKVSPAFAVQVGRLCERMVDAGFRVDPRMADGKVRSRVNHSLVGHLAVLDWLLGRGVAKADASRLASVVGSHHGMTPEWSRLAEVAEQEPYAGGVAWGRVRDAVLERAAGRCGPRFVEGLSSPSLVLLTGLVIVADWIASNAELFPLWGLDEMGEPDDARSLRRLKAGWSELGLPERWVAPVSGEVGETFSARFGMPARVVRDVQVGAVEAARAMRGSGLLILEAPMGSGKTEAALLAVEVLARDSGAGGCFVALPTQATTDAMFGRVRSWLDRVPGGATLALAHGKAHLNDEYAGLIRRGRFNTEFGAVAHDWLRGRKKAVLANFVVGTIDQVLFAGLKSRHVMLRHLGLAGKVVVIDEVHAYDVYMSRYLHRVLRWLGAYQVPVVLLSATLPDARRTELLRAYDDTADVPPGHPGYPVVSATNLPPRTFPLPDRSTPVTIDRLDDDLSTLSAYLREHLRDGGCAVVVRNTVGRVQETAAHLADEFAGEIDVTINHARFLACDRAVKDRELLSRFGPPGRAGDRPRGHVVVASQVVEQSLDIDFDLMVTDLAPVDLVLQRMGRLHRHARPDRPRPVRRARCAITGVDWSHVPPEPVRGSAVVYDLHHLLRAAALLDRPSVTLPHDIAWLVQAAYGEERLGPGEWWPAMDDARRRADERARRRRDAARTYLLPEPAGTDLVGWLHADVGEVGDDDPRAMAQVRDGAESVEVLVVQRDTDGGLRTADWVPGGGQQIPLMGELPWRLARTISVCSLRLPYALCHEGVIDAVITELERTKVASFQDTPALRGQLVLALDDDRRATLHGHLLTYDQTRGLLHERI